MSENILSLGQLLDPNQFESYIEEASKLETVVHKYGTQFKIPDYPCWMAYKNEGNIEGSISFTRNTKDNPILNEMIEKVMTVFKTIFINGLEPKPERIHFIRTIGNIVPHKDEAGRTACINIGLKNSSSAITRISNDGLYETFNKNNTPYIVKEGFGYLLNTNQIHSVESLNTEPRYLITYGFGVPFNTLTKHFKVG